MTCNHCVGRVKDAILSLKGIIKVEINLEEKTGIVEHVDNINQKDMKKAVEEIGLGYKIIKAEDLFQLL